MEARNLEAYKKTGKFPEGTLIVKELTLVLNPTFPDGSRTEPSGRGFFNGPFNGIDATVKDSKRFAKTNGWGFFTFGHHAMPYAASAAEAPVSECAGCHMTNVAKTDMKTRSRYTLMLETTKELEELSQEVRSTASPERLQANAQTISDLVASGLSASALREGDVAPDFSLPDAREHVVALKTLLDRGPVVISFYRGGWCPFCNLELRGLQRVLPEIVQMGAALVAISPQLPDNSLSTQEKNQLTFPVLSDVGNIVAKRFGIVFTLPTALVEANRAIGRDLVEINGEAGAAQLPMPATFVLDKSGIIRLAFVQEDWSKRLDPDIVVDTLRGLGK